MHKRLGPRPYDPELLEYDPNRLIDTLIQILELKNDAALARSLQVAPPAISKIRHGRLRVSPAMLLRMHEVTDLSIADLRFLMGDHQKVFCDR